VQKQPQFQCRESGWLVMNHNPWAGQFERVLIDWLANSDHSAIQNGLDLA
jgi:hypothetical protein